MEPLTTAEISSLLSETVISTGPKLREILTYSFRGGKGLRPGLVMACSHFGLHDSQEVQRVAAAVELIHLASLIHDDILDEADTRRSLPALHSLLGTVPAVLAGDYFFATAFGLIAKSKKAILYTVTEAVREMCSGELEQSSSHFPDMGTYYAYAGKKTGALISAACRCGGILCRLKRPQLDILAGYGRHLGIAYQIIDDILDFYGSPEKTGKPCRQDIARGIITLPVIHFLQLSPDNQQWREKITRGLTPSEIERLIELTKNLGCHLYAAQMARKEMSIALSLLEKMPAGAARDTLAQKANHIFLWLEDMV